MEHLTAEHDLKLIDLQPKLKNTTGTETTAICEIEDAACQTETVAIVRQETGKPPSNQHVEEFGNESVDGDHLEHSSERKEYLPDMMPPKIVRPAPIKSRAPVPRVPVVPRMPSKPRVEVSQEAPTRREKENSPIVEEQKAVFEPVPERAVTPER